MKIKTILSLAAVAAATLSCKPAIEFDACGQIDAVQVTVSSEAAGRILSLDLAEGDTVIAGEVVGAIDSVQTWLQIRELSERIEGARSRMIDIPMQMASNESQLAGLENDLKVYTALLQNNAATQKQVDDLKVKISTLKRQMSAQRQTWERNNSVTASEIATYTVQMDQRKDQLSKCRITIPATGTVLTKYVEAGESVTVGKPLFKLADLKNVYVRAYFTTEQLAGLKLGDKLTVIPDDGTDSPKEYEGRLTWISDQAEFTPKNIQTRDERADLVYAVKVSVPNDGTLRLGMYAYVRK